jgi:hypothetical protein
MSIAASGAILMNEAVLPRALGPGVLRLLNPTAFLCLVGVLIPNALSLGALVTGIGLPPRTAMIVAYATLAVAARIVSAPVTIALDLAAAAYDAISTIALQFNLAPSEIGLALHLGGQLNLLRSPFYMILIGLSVVLVVGNLALMLYRRDLLGRGSPVLMMVLALGLAATDFIVNTSPHYHYGTLYAKGRPMESAVESSGLRKAAIAHPDRNVMLVIVEALGEFADPAYERLFLDSLRAAQAGGRYTVTSGSTTYYGSTTAAEMRELCYSREPYQALLERDGFTCLPTQMAKAGYRTVSLHHFAARFFDREHWYPKLGFERRIFREDLADTPFRNCGGPFRGPCDIDMIPVIEKELQAKQPTFLYWLTLSTHVPIAPAEGTPRLGCRKDGGRVHHKEVCFMTEMWMDVLEALAKMTADVPPTEILIVGDHAPPLWSKSGRHLFVPGKVPWFRLTPNSEAFRTSQVR